MKLKHALLILILLVIIGVGAEGCSFVNTTDSDKLLKTAENILINLKWNTYIDETTYLDVNESKRYPFTAEEDARVDVIILADENSGLLYPSCSISNSQKGSETCQRIKGISILEITNKSPKVVKIEIKASWSRANG